MTNAAAHVARIVRAAASSSAARRRSDICRCSAAATRIHNTVGFSDNVSSHLPER
ncbi:MAG: hypothetical protein H7138_23785 [Myxococcales bacterium]|nr:hypothetical protein [Myxococcales bacterium]